MGITCSRNGNSFVLRIVPHLTDSAVHVEDEMIVVLIGTPNSGKISVRLDSAPAKSTVLAIAQFSTHAPRAGRLRQAANSRMRVTTTKVDVRGNSVILLDTPDLGSLVNGREVVVRDILNLVSKSLRKSSYHRRNALTGILYFQNIDGGQAVPPDIECFSEICESSDLYSSVILVATGEQLGEVSAGGDAGNQGTRIFPYLDIRESAEEGDNAVRARNRASITDPTVLLAFHAIYLRRGGDKPTLVFGERNSPVPLSRGARHQNGPSTSWRSEGEIVIDLNLNMVIFEKSE
ncbi:hypothetical protein F5J12DRAFT_789266 [Pisolithus orientalis]|uniref:uncharacterized protein n=1 Tax=Pisolithus orientalis TaxID=936130 RepID=UPI002225AD99|nr:uncharacterized protein F5J12DRAFT_789266 [Pisolithus orientalis]KAI5980430.1 hypothetical protein F5J12DRAFT_789266 [Pisolithus orientalis]